MEAYAALARLSAGYSPLEGRSPTYYSPVRHSTSVLLRLLVRLACVRRAASVRSEPGSNSHMCVLELDPRATTSIHLPLLALFSCQRTGALRRAANSTILKGACQAADGTSERTEGRDGITPCSLRGEGSSRTRAGWDRRRVRYEVTPSRSQAYPSLALRDWRRVYDNDQPGLGHRGLA